MREGKVEQGCMVQRETVALKRVIMWREKCLQPDYALPCSKISVS
jgi:hypothetical protein